MEDVHIDLYGFCFRLRDVYKDMISAVEMQASLNTKMLDGWYQDLLEPNGPVHRKDNAVVYDIGFIPCRCQQFVQPVQVCRLKRGRCDCRKGIYSPGQSPVTAQRDKRGHPHAALVRTVGAVPAAIERIPEPSAVPLHTRTRLRFHQCA